MTTYSYSSDAPGEIRTGLLIVPVFQGPAPGPGVREMGLADAYAGAKLTGKKGEHLLVTARTGDRFAAGAVLLVGVGPKAEFTVDAARRALGRAAGTARRFGTVATTFPTVFSAKQAADAVGASIEGLGLGAYRFDRYRTKKADGKDLRRITAVGPARWERQAAERRGEAGRHPRRGRLVGARPREHPRRRHAARRDRPRGPGHGEAGGAHVQDLEREAAGGGRLQRHPGRGQGQREPAAPDRAEVHRGGTGDADRAHRQGHRVRLGRPVDQGRQGHGDDEGRHGRRGLDPGHDEGDRPAEAEDQRDRRDPVQREHAERFGAEARRRHHPPRRHHVGGAQHRRGGPARAGGRARLPRREEAAADHRHRDAHGRLHGGVGRPHLRRVRQRS